MGSGSVFGGFRERFGKGFGKGLGQKLDSSGVFDRKFGNYIGGKISRGFSSKGSCSSRDSTGCGNIGSRHSEHRSKWNRCHDKVDSSGSCRREK